MFEIPLQSLKSLIFENQLTYQSESFDISVHSMATQIEIKPFIDSFKQKNNIFLPLEWKVYDPQMLDYKPFETQNPLSAIFLLSPVIMFKYRELSLADPDFNSTTYGKIQSDGKKQRNRERTIKDVIQYVKQWRQIHNSLDKNKNKVNLYDAARVVGIAKKSLDDYFCQLRLAEEYGFDFETNLDKKIGILRSFVRKNRSKGSQSHKHERLPRTLRIIEDYDLSNNNLPQNVVCQKVEKIQQGYEVFPAFIESEIQPQFSSIVSDQMQNRFLSCFNFVIDDLADPFINYGCLPSINYKNNDNQSEQYLFF